MFDWPEISGRLREADPTVTFEWTDKSLFIVPAEVTRDKRIVYHGVCGKLHIGLKSLGAPYRFYATVKHWVAFGDHKRFKGMPDPLLPRTLAFEQLQRDIKDLRRYHEIRNNAFCADEAAALLANPFVAMWK